MKKLSIYIFRNDVINVYSKFHFSKPRWKTNIPCRQSVESNSINIWAACWKLYSLCWDIDEILISLIAKFPVGRNYAAQHNPELELFVELFFQCKPSDSEILFPPPTNLSIISTKTYLREFFGFVFLNVFKDSGVFYLINNKFCGFQAHVSSHLMVFQILWIPLKSSFGEFSVYLQN